MSTSLINLGLDDDLDYETNKYMPRNSGPVHRQIAQRRRRLQPRDISYPKRSLMKESAFSVSRNSAPQPVKETFILACQSFGHSLEDTCRVFISRPRRYHQSALTQHAFQQSPSPAFTPTSLSTPSSLPSISLPESPESSTSSPSMLPDSIQLPVPGVADLIPKTNKTSHARRQPAGHIPRPRNAFILFRCDFVLQKKIPGYVESDHRNLSRIAGKIWRGMKKDQQKPWIDLALKEKERHAKMYPGYKYMPVQHASRQKKVKVDRLDGEERELESRKAELSSVLVQRTHDNSAKERPAPYPTSSRPRRSSSCPPVGATPVNPSTDLDSWAPFLVAHDDLARRPSRTTMYHSVSSAPITSPLIPPCHFPNFGDPWFNAEVPSAWPLLDKEDDSLFENQPFYATPQDNPLVQQNAELYAQSSGYKYSSLDALPWMSPLSMDMGGALGLDPFDFDDFTFNADYLPSMSSDVSSTFSPLEFSTLNNADSMEGLKGSEGPC